ncbi:p-loop domain-containing protein [Desulfonema limicola]|uniref:P-loop domain-containing protein n=1 Tax=Desulfonema limicola TaxID=45656 RepID=A0A975BDX1_9BACT|nr:hypothetical protein [Desulfonema limicola]QTA83884.1 p-loop domain-containing protein [Desulfonema limicola]
MQRIIDQINLIHIASCTAIIIIICLGFGVGTVFFTRIILITACLAGIGLGFFLIWDTWKKKDIEIYKEPAIKPARPIVFNVLNNTGAIPENILELAGINKMLTAGRGHDQDVSENLPPVIPAIAKSLVLVLLGSQGTGKTTLLCHLIDARSDGQAIIIDPHGYPGKYNGHEITGAGRNYSACDDCMQWLMDEVNRRYKDYYNKQYKMLYVYIDEATLLKKNCGSFQSFMEIMLTESRKVNIRLTLCLHSRRAKFLGLDGAMDLAEGINWLNLKHENGKRWGELETDRGNVSYSLPGPYHAKNTEEKTSSSWSCSEPPSADPIIYQADKTTGFNQDEPINMTRIGYDTRPEMGTDKQQNIYDCLFYSIIPLRAIDVSNKTGLEPGYVRVTLSRMAGAGVIIRNSNNTYETPG